MCENWKEIWTLNSFAGLLSDAIAFDIDAKQRAGKKFPLENRLARSSIICAVFSLECAANACIERLQYPSIVVDQLDRVGILDKYDILYTSRFSKSIDRGSKPFQFLRELFCLRNRYVHPKLDKIQMTISQEESGDLFYKKPEDKTAITPIMKIPCDFFTWTGVHSRVVVIETLSFLNHFFVELCGLNPEQCSNLLAVHTKGPSQSATFIATHDREIFEKVKDEYNIEIKFLVF